MDSSGLGALGFWLFIAAIIVVSTWAKSRRKAEEHETLRRIVEKTGVVDGAQLKDLFSEPPSEDWKPGYGYRWLRVSGAIVSVIGGGVATFFLIAFGLGRLVGAPGKLMETNEMIGGIAVSAAIAIVGLGIFFTSRFAQPPHGPRDEPQAS